MKPKSRKSKVGKLRFKNMRKTILTFCAFIVPTMLLFSCGNSDSKETLSSNEDNTSEGVASSSSEVSIGKQVWMTENLNLNHFRNGELIPEAKTNEEWLKAGENKQPAWCYYDNDCTNGEKYGKLYNWFTVTDPRGLAPEGWHVPSDDEWSTLSSFLGGKNIAGFKMKSKIFWFNDGFGSDESSFAGLPGGQRSNSGTFSFLEMGGYWWSTKNERELNALHRDLYYNNSELISGNNSKAMGFSVRCIKN